MLFREYGSSKATKTGENLKYDAFSASEGRRKQQKQQKTGFVMLFQ
jgi:hypothetical protein